jgi:hypothetical protein
VCLRFVKKILKAYGLSFQIYYPIHTYISCKASHVHCFGKLCAVNITLWNHIMLKIEAANCNIPDDTQTPAFPYTRINLNYNAPPPGVHIRPVFPNKEFSGIFVLVIIKRRLYYLNQMFILYCSEPKNV